MFENYSLNGIFDEVFAEPSDPRAHYAPVFERLRGLAKGPIQRRVRMADASFRNQGITFTVCSDSSESRMIFMGLNPGEVHYATTAG